DEAHRSDDSPRQVPGARAHGRCPHRHLPGQDHRPSPAPRRRRDVRRHRQARTPQPEGTRMHPIKAAPIRSNTPTPPRAMLVEWTGPSGWRVWANEDGVHIPSPGRDTIEDCEVADLIALWTAAKEAVAGGSVPAPRPPIRDE